MVVLLWFRILKLILLPSPGCTPASEERRRSGAQMAPGHRPACCARLVLAGGRAALLPASPVHSQRRSEALFVSSLRAGAWTVVRFTHSTCTKATCSQTLTAFHALCPADDILGGTCQPRFLKAFGVFLSFQTKCWALCFNVNSEQWPLGPVTKNQTCN
ncbi:unnamed protein product [Rangifer tarandus platyrhynchus]|uniref:Uncharacterized protein n=1 Tax=Rangifer tarandus platyrhynchus TaxID=3082113 RepID=A0AC59YHG6_RANTA